MLDSNDTFTKKKMLLKAHFDITVWMMDRAQEPFAPESAWFKFECWFKLQK